jgi:catechol 2,3-dioxygenase-like lactoylglutathione lyase family enzyme
MAGSIRAKAFSHLAISVSDLDVARRFYNEALGFTPGRAYRSAGRGLAGLMEASPDGFSGIFLCLGDFLLELLAHAHGRPAEQVPRPPAEFGYAHISFIVDDIDATIALIETAGGELRTRRVYHFADSNETTIVFCTDPDGNRIELITHSADVEAPAHGRYLGLDVLGWPAAEELRRTRQAAGRDQ